TEPDAGAVEHCRRPLHPAVQLGVVERPGALHDGDALGYLARLAQQAYREVVLDVRGHGVTTTLPKTSRSSSSRSASRISSSGRTRSMTGSSLPSRTRSSSASRSLRRQPLLPLMSSSRTHTNGW